ncbi:beta-N-acetylhexosaminidase [bacterium]|nr:beta-N-acetylhexosaminidase [bacterium]
MKLRLVGFLVAACVAWLGTGCSAFEAAPPVTKVPNGGIIPAPAHFEPAEGAFVIRAATQIFVSRTANFGSKDKSDREAAEFLRNSIKERTGLELKLQSVGGDFVHEKPRKGTIWLDFSAVASKNPEGYRLTIAPDGITIMAPTGAGLFYGAVSLLQMIEAQNPGPGKPVAVPAARIQDQPRFGYRGMMIDESAHHLGVACTKQTIDMMAWLKINRLHWHVADTRGFRIEIKQYPKLTQIGPEGARTLDPSGKWFFTQDDVRELVQYARDRNVMIIPEIDMPGHAIASTRAYPEINGGGNPEGWTFNPAKEQTYEFLQNVLTEVADLFPDTPYIHVGGDEVYLGYKAWEKSPEISAFMRDKGFKYPVELEHYFNRRMAGFIKTKLNRDTMGWDEMTSSGITRDNLILFWWHNEWPLTLKKSLGDGYRWVLCPRDPCYFDFVQFKGQKVGRTIYRSTKLMNDLWRVYDNYPDRYYNYVPAGAEKNVLGIEACTWMGSAVSIKRVQFLFYPRLAAIAEDGWTPADRKNLDDFKARVPLLLKEFDRRGIYYCNPFDPTLTPEPAAGRQTLN